jgi:7-cyano-7-deazaguanine synthase
MDSSTVLALALHEGREVETVSFLYPSKHNQLERVAASFVASHYKVCFKFVDLSGVLGGMKSDLLLSGGPLPEGHYEAESMKQTVVPGRNIIFASVLAGIAMSEGAEEVWLGIHAGDHVIYPDCRPAFFRYMRSAILHGTDGKVKLRAPFIDKTKAYILRRGMELRVPYHLTRTCYSDQPMACGRCGACQERLQSHKEVGLEDPLEYEFRDLFPKQGGRE